MNQEKELSFGQKAVGISFNPGNKPYVNDLKQKFADVIDVLDKIRQDSVDGEVKRLTSVAITEAQTAQMWAVKAVTWETK